MAKLDYTVNATTFLWILKDVHSSEIFNGNNLRSCIFPCERDSERQWHMSLSLNSLLSLLQPRIYVHTNEKLVNIKATIKLSVLNAAFCVVAKQEKVFNFTRNGEHCSFCLPRTDTSSNNVGATSEHGDIALLCRITILEKSDHGNDSDHTSAANCNLVKSLDSLRKSGRYSDFLVQTEDRKFYCHKFILACRSEYFSVMLKHRMREANENKLVLADLRSDVIEKLIVYIYTGQANVTEADAFDLFLAADRFQLERLKLLCEERIHSLLCVENAAEIFHFASVYNIHTLKMNAFHFLDMFVDKATLKGLGKTHGRFMGSKGNSKAPNEFERDVEKRIDTMQLLQIPVIKLNPVKSTVVTRRTKRTFVPKADFWGYTVKQVLSVCTFVFQEREARSPMNVICSRMVIGRDAIWKLEIRTVTKYHNSNYIYLYINLLSKTNENTSFSLEYNLEIYDTKQRKVYKLHGICQCVLFEYSEICFMPVGPILSNKHLHHKDGIHLHCSLIAWKSVVYDYTPPKIPKCDLTDNLLSALEEKKFTDVFVKVENEVFACHKIILASNIPYFAYRFEDADCSETIVLDDIEPAAFRKILFALYTGRCEFTLSEVEKLLSVCDKYNLLNLPSNFVEVYLSTLQVNNCAEILLFADRHNAEKVKNNAITFIAHNMESVIKSEGWSLLARHENLILSCFEVYFSPAVSETTIL